MATIVVTQRRSLQVQTSSGLDDQAVAADVQTSCRLSSPDCVVSVDSSRRALRSRPQRAAAARPSRPMAATISQRERRPRSSRRELQQSVTALSVTRSLPEDASLNDEVPVAAGTVVLTSSVEAVDATMHVTRQGGATEAAELSGGLTEASVVGKLANDLGVSTHQLSAVVSNPIFPPHPPPSTPPAPPSPPPASPSPSHPPPAAPPRATRRAATRSTTVIPAALAAAVAWANGSARAGESSCEPV